MNKSEAIPVIIISSLLLLYCILILTGTAIGIAEFIFIISPVAVAWMVYQVIRYGKKEYPELKDEQEWGYLDKE
ncbi:MAG: hypothetical protein JNK27_00475 [Chitinophagaceae bacterium]|nr:hypothetical protein [Chitinophagaceae bacterium]